MKYYNQNSYKVSGLACCLAMAVSAITDTLTNPEVLTPDLSEFGLMSTVTTEISRAIECIESGGVAIADVKGSLLFHSTSHVCMIKNNNGRLVVIDPNLYQDKYINDNDKIKIIGCYAYIMPEDFAPEAGAYTLYFKSPTPIPADRYRRARTASATRPANQPVPDQQHEPVPEQKQTEPANQDYIPFPRSFRIPESYKGSEAYRSPVPTQATTPSTGEPRVVHPVTDEIEVEPVQETPSPRYNFRSFRANEPYRRTIIKDEPVFVRNPVNAPTVEPIPAPPCDPKTELLVWANSVGLDTSAPDAPVTNAEMWAVIKKMLNQ